MGEFGSSTIWKGAAFNCNSGNKIILLHSRFKESSENHTKTCNNGTIVGWNLRSNNGTYTSRLNVTVNYDTIGNTIQCGYDMYSSTSTIGIGSFTISAGIKRMYVILS